MSVDEKLICIYWYDGTQPVVLFPSTASFSDVPHAQWMNEWYFQF